MVRHLFALTLAAAVCLGGAARANWFNDELDNYKGADAGRLVVSVSAERDPLYRQYNLLVRRLDGSVKGEVEYRRGIMGTEDYADTSGSGTVSVTALKLGAYEIYGFEFQYDNGTMSGRFKSDVFSIPFTIVAGQTLYLGNFLAHDQYGTPNFLGVSEPAGGTFAVSDQSARDLPLAKRKDTAIADVTIAIVDLKPAIDRRKPVTAQSDEAPASAAPPTTGGASHK